MNLSYIIEAGGHVRVFGAERFLPDGQDAFSDSHGFVKLASTIQGNELPV